MPIWMFCCCELNNKTTFFSGFKARRFIFGMMMNEKCFRDKCFPLFQYEQWLTKECFVNSLPNLCPNSDGNMYRMFII